MAGIIGVGPMDCGECKGLAERFGLGKDERTWEPVFAIHTEAPIYLEAKLWKMRPLAEERSFFGGIYCGAMWELCRARAGEPAFGRCGATRATVCLCVE